MGWDSLWDGWPEVLCGRDFYANSRSKVRGSRSRFREHEAAVRGNRPRVALSICGAFFSADVFERFIILKSLSCNGLRLCTAMWALCRLCTMTHNQQCS